MGDLTLRRLRFLAAPVVGLLVATVVWAMGSPGLTDARILALAATRLPVPLPLAAPRIVVAKGARTLTLLDGEIFIHGGGTSRDWTRGCVAVADADIEDLFAAAPAGTPVTITP